MKARDYFPLGKAHGKAFCNRTIETDWLVNNIQACKHSLIIAPRRFGKSSLAEKAIELSEFPVVCLNFNTCSDEKDVDHLIRQGISNLIGKAIGPIEKSIAVIKTYAKHLTPKINVGTTHAQIELTANQQSSPATNVQDTLVLMEKLLESRKRRAILLLDEFQTVGIIAKGGGVEAAIRNMAQDMQYLAIIFSGSNRSLLRTMFDDENRPLYKICRKLHLDRISEDHYKKHLNIAAKLAWGELLQEKTFRAIMVLSDRHPYYVNYLCDILWSHCKKLPLEIDVSRAWAQLLDEEYSDANAELASLSLGQRRVLKFLSNHKSEGLMSATTITAIGMPMSSISTVLSVLVEKDVLEKDEKAYRIINPVLRYILSESFNSQQ